MDIVLYGSSNCQGCVQVKNYLDSRGLPYRYVDVIKEEPDRVIRSIPTVYAGQRMLNGPMEVIEYLRKFEIKDGRISEA